MERTSEESLPPENTAERMDDRPPVVDTEIDIAPGALDDTALESGGGSAIDDV